MSGDSYRDHFVVRAFLDELGRWKINDTNPPLHLVHKRMLLADMILTEIGGDDIEGLALRALADAAHELCMWPADVDTVKAYLAARRAHLEILHATFPTH